MEGVGTFSRTLSHMALSHSGNFTASGDRKRADHTLSHERVQKEKGANEVNEEQMSKCQI